MCLGGCLEQRRGQETKLHAAFLPSNCKTVSKSLLLGNMAKERSSLTSYWQLHLHGGLLGRLSFVWLGLGVTRGGVQGLLSAHCTISWSLWWILRDSSFSNIIGTSQYHIPGYHSRGLCTFQIHACAPLLRTGKKTFLA